MFDIPRENSENNNVFGNFLNILLSVTCETNDTIMDTVFVKFYYGNTSLKEHISSNMVAEMNPQGYFVVCVF